MNPIPCLRVVLVGLRALAWLQAVIDNHCVRSPRVSWMHCYWFTVSSSILFDSMALAGG